MEEEYILEMHGIVKEFPGVRALKGVDFNLKPGEVHTIMGENGAGKSTLIKILTGVYEKDGGNIVFNGREVHFHNTFDAQKTGISTVYQELNMIPYLSVGENIYLGRYPRTKAGIDWKSLHKNAQKLLDDLGLDIESRLPLNQYGTASQQMVSIVRAVSLNCQVVVLDEPTSSLTEKETARLFDLVKELSGRGISILYISHRMAEIFEICDRVTVFKDGTYVTTMDTGDICADDIIRAMVGRELGNLYPTKSSCIAADDPVLEVNGLTGSIFREVSFALRRGEILGFAGLVGAGRSEVMRGLCAIDPIRSGQVVLNGRPCAFHTYRDAVDAGICYLTEDRKTQGLFLEMSIKNNMSSANMKGVSHGIWLDDKLERSLANRFVEQLAIKIPGIEYPISSLSGGNQQKCLIGKWLSLAPKVIIMDEPTRGIDVGAKREIHALLRQLAESGVGVIVVSSELPEVIGVSDRVAVMHEGCLAGFLEGEEVTEENIMKLASGEQLAEKELRQ